jgi:hypothetical protein
MITKFTLSLAAGTALALASPAFADSSSASRPAAAAQSGPAQASPASIEGLSMLSDSDLDKLRGGQEIVLTNQTLTAITSGNVINGNFTAGNVSISDFALSNFNGIGNLLINTGAQDSLQTGMNLTINVNQ